VEWKEVTERNINKRIKNECGKKGGRERDGNKAGA
jgi:hypothetical protein